MADRASKGTCRFCGSSYSGGGIARHLKACAERQAQQDRPPGEGRGQAKAAPIYHIQVEGTYRPAYWMHLEVPGYLRLADLDQFLRDVWLECCGHLSAFRIGKQSYHSHAELAADFGEKTMDVRVDEVLKPDLAFEHEYDFGTTTYLTLKVRGVRQGQARGRPIDVMARNDPPEFLCSECGKPATEMCPNCVWDDKGWLCDDCAPKHKCGFDFLLPIVNSPRMGECGYTGPD
jgi:hypothetical protein